MSQRMARAVLRSAPHFGRDLVGGAADPAGLHLQHRPGVADGLLEDVEAVVLRPLLDQLERVVQDAPGEVLLAASS